MVIKTLSICNSGSFQNLVRKGGFEPPRLSAPPPQDGVSASSTTSALGLFTPTSARTPDGRKRKHNYNKLCLPHLDANRTARSGPGVDHRPLSARHYFKFISGM